MAVRRVLVDCAVLALQDSCVFYPCCKNCVCKIGPVQRDTTRWQCWKCGYSCVGTEVDHRYRLSLQVARDSHIFGVTVFGTCLNPLFGISASGLQRLVEVEGESQQMPARTALLVRAVEDCLLGRHFSFGFKLTDAGCEPWLRPTAPGSVSNDPVQLIASQMLLPVAGGLAGCTVVACYQMLLQKAAECEQEANASTVVLLTPCHPSASSFTDVCVPASVRLSRSLQRLRTHNNTLSPTPPWEQSLQVVTSSAEQDGGCDTQDSAENNSRLGDKTKSHCTETGFSQTPRPRRKRMSLSLSCLEPRSSSSSSFFCAILDPMADGGSGGNTSFPDKVSILSPRDSGPLPLSCGPDGSPETSLSEALAWEEMPFSESLGEFLRDENSDLDRVCKTEDQREKSIHDPAARQSQIENLPNECVPVYKCKSRFIHSSRSAMELVDITNISPQTHKNPAGDVCDHEEDEDTESPAVGKLESQEDCLEENIYDYSADLFSGSAMADSNAETLGADTDPSRRTSDKHRNRLQMLGLAVTPDTRAPRRDEMAAADLIQQDSSQPLDFFPSSQSTPVGKESAGITASARAHLARRFASRQNLFNENLCQQDNKTPARKKHSLVALRGRSRFKGSAGRTPLKSDSNAFNRNACDGEDCDTFVPPSAAKTQWVMSRRRRWGSGSSPGRHRQHPLACKRNLLAPIASPVVCAQTEDAGAGRSCDLSRHVQGSVHVSVCGDGGEEDREEETRDWSRDLFSDSV